MRTPLQIGSLLALAAAAGLLSGCRSAPIDQTTKKPAAGAAAAPEPTQKRRRRRIGRMDSSRSFYHPDFAVEPTAILGQLDDRELTADQYARYLAGRFGTRFVEDLAFEIALERECARLRLARSAPVLARSLAAQRFHESGRDRATDPDGSLQRKFLNESLRQMRTDALVGLRRSQDQDAVRGLFDRRYGVDGARVEVRQILVSLAGTRRRAPNDATEPELEAAARARAREIHGELERGASFESLLGRSDDRTTRALLRRPEQRARAGVLGGYNYQRYGEDFAAAVRALDVGKVSAPIRTSVGYHIIELLSRTQTPFARVAKSLQKELRRGPAKPAEVARLRADLLQRYGFRRQRAQPVR